MRPHSLSESAVVSDGVGRGLAFGSPPTTMVSPSGSPGRVSEEAVELRESWAGREGVKDDMTGSERDAAVEKWSVDCVKGIV